MVDVVANHFAWAGNHTTIDYGQFHPFNSPEYFHPFRLLSDDLHNRTCDVDVSWRLGNIYIHAWHLP